MAWAKLITLAVLACMLGCGSTGAVEATGYTPVDEFDPARDARQDIQAAIAEAKRSGRRVLLDVGGDWCSWCKKLDGFFDDNPDVREVLHRSFVVVKVNVSPENENEEALTQYPEVEGYPHFFVLDDAGVLLKSQGTGELEEGPRHDRAKVLAFLEEWAPR